MSEADDRRFMAEALRLGRRNLGFTTTNPSVGCVLVKDGEIVSAAVTAPGGRPHAEAQALAQAGEKARGATAYVTLEPCSHWGKTPPCANALVEAGVARVVVAVNDPDPRVSGRGYTILRDAGIEVETGLMEREGRRQLAGYLMRQVNKRPYVTLKLALSADGMLGRPGEEVAITGAAARREVHRIRAESDGILVGIGTVLADDPELTVRLSGLEERSPVRIILDRDLRLPLDSRLVKSAHVVPVIAVTDKGEEDRRTALVGAGVDVIDAATLHDLLTQLAQRGISNLMVEGGATVASAFLQAGLVDRIALFESDIAIGKGGLESPLTRADMPEDFSLVETADHGPDRCFVYERPF